MKYLGVSEGFHDAAVALIDDRQTPELVFASHSERYSRIKNDKYIPEGLFRLNPHDERVYYEDFRLKNERRKAQGRSPKEPQIACRYHTGHHLSHAGAAWYTSTFPAKDTVVVVVDAIGEWQTITTWLATDYGLQLLSSKKYPFSVGLFYSAITKRIGLKPNEDEYITMGMAAYGEPFIDMTEHFYRDCSKGFSLDDFRGHHPYDIAASAQAMVENYLLKEVFEPAREHGKYLCYGGGVALNCVANTKIRALFDDMWIFPSPGDAGSAVGCVLAHLKKKMPIKDVYWGYNIERDVNPKEVVEHLLKHKVAGVANGKAEFGPRALGNRSLLGSPDAPNLKRVANKIKQRQQFRPFAPAVLSEYADLYFTGPKNEYMQFVSKANHPFKSVTHVDGTARVQIVPPDSTSILRPILEEYYRKTGIAMLLNTSLNVKGEPMVNSRGDAERFEKKYKVKVF